MPWRSLSERWRGSPALYLPPHPHARGSACEAPAREHFLTSSIFFLRNRGGESRRDRGTKSDNVMPSQADSGLWSKGGRSGRTFRSHTSRRIKIKTLASFGEPLKTKSASPAVCEQLGGPRNSQEGTRARLPSVCLHLSFSLPTRFASLNRRKRQPAGSTLHVAGLSSGS